MTIAKRLKVAGIALALTVLPAAPAAADDTVPFSDPNAVGALGFCDRSGHEVTSGKIGAAPFAWTAVSSVAAPAGYSAAKGGRAGLFAYQPIKYVDPGDWSGKQFTAASQFTNTAHPMARATVLDPALVDFVSVFPPHWDGLVQFRMFFSAPDQPQQTQQYSAAVVRVQGDSWTLVSGGHPACKSGDAVSAETQNLPPRIFDQPTPRSTPGVKPSGAGGRHAGTTTSAAAGRGSSGSTPAGAAASGPAEVSPVAATSREDGGEGSAGGWWLVLVVAALGAAGAAAWWRRHRSA